ncbi:MAG: hypothetical protein M1831_006694 [Alyxoria varia]|nr:MAG: hypothetical protein M1831_006694 [Alyxoria varia]
MAAISFTRHATDGYPAATGHFRFNTEMIGVLYGILLGGGLCLLYRAIKFHKEYNRRRSSTRQYQSQSDQSPSYTDSEKAEHVEGLDTTKSTFTQNVTKQDPRCGEKKGVQWWHNDPPANWPSTKLARFGDCAFHGIANCARKVSLSSYSPFSPGGFMVQDAEAIPSERRGTWINEIVGPFDQQDGNARSSHASVSSSCSAHATNPTAIASSSSSSSYASAMEESETSQDDEEEVEARRRQPVPVDERGRRGKKSVVPCELMKSSFWKERLVRQKADDEHDVC